ncbi:Protein of unknown function [Escherichia coli D6-113.11]
MTERG